MSFYHFILSVVNPAMHISGTQDMRWQQNLNRTTVYHMAPCTHLVIHLFSVHLGAIFSGQSTYWQPKANRTENTGREEAGMHPKSVHHKNNNKNTALLK